MASRLPQPLQAHFNEIGFVSEMNDRFYGVYLGDNLSALAKAEIDKQLLLMEKGGLDGMVFVSSSSHPVIYEVAGPSKK